MLILLIGLICSAVRPYESARALDPLPFLVVALVIVCLWPVVMWLIAQISGWAALAQHYRAGRRPEGIRYFWRSMRVAPFAGYNGCLNITLSSEGIHMVPLLFFRFGHPALLIPWERVGEMREKTFVFRRCYLPIHAAGRDLQLYLPCSARNWVERHAARKA